MSTRKEQSDNFLPDLLKFQGSLNGKSRLLDELRIKGAEEVKRLSFPGRKDEEWRFINLRDLYTGHYVFASEVSYDLPDIESWYIPESDGARLVLINGLFSAKHSSTEALPEGLLIGNLADIAAEGNTVIEQHLHQYADFKDDIFTSFNTAYIKDGAVIYVPRDMKVDTPVQLLNIQTEASEPYFATSRGLVVADEGSELTLIEDHLGLGSNKYFNLPILEINLERGATVKHTKIQRDSLEAIHIGRTAVHLASRAEYESYTITIGAKLSRNEPRITQLEEDVKFTVDGLVLIDGKQVSDTHSVMDHRFPHAESHQLHKCVINDQAHSVFNGKIFVRKDAQKIDSFQENRNLLLSRKGLVNTKPQLEIFADDVVCTHGATVGQLEEDEVFYLKSRGLSEQQARELLTYAFALETIENITVDSVQKLLVDEVHKFTDRQLDSATVS